MITCEQNEQVSGEIECPPMCDDVARGWSLLTEGGAWGIYVGTTPTGREWYAYDPNEFLQFCREFDAMYGKVRQ